MTTMVRAFERAGGDPTNLGRAGFGSFMYVMGDGRRPSTAPNYLAAELGNSCQLTCKHCIYGGNRVPLAQDKPNTSALDEVVAQMADFRPLLTSFAGMEPTLHGEALDKHLRLMRSQTERLVVMTNGLLLRECLYELPNHVDISVDGPRGIHDFVRGADGLFDKTMSNVKKLVAAGQRVGIIATAMRLTLPDGRQQIEVISELARYLASTFAGKVPLTLSLYYGQPGDPMLLDRSDISRVLELVGGFDIDIRVLWPSHYVHHVAACLGSLEGVVSDSSGIPVLSLGNTRHLLFHLAEEALVGLRLGHDGNVYPGCTYLNFPRAEWPRFVMGNIMNDRLSGLAEKVRN